MNLHVTGECGPLEREGAFCRPGGLRGSWEYKVHPYKHLHSRTKHPTLSLPAVAVHSVSLVAPPPLYRILGLIISTDCSWATGDEGHSECSDGGLLSHTACPELSL